MSFKPVSIGHLSILADVQVFEADGLDDHGQPTGKWVTVFQAWVHRVQLSGRSLEIARQLVELATHNVYCNYDEQITRSCRFVLLGDVYDVGAIDTNGNLQMRCTCTEVWPDASR